ncbi:MAG: hypothetical protein II819_13130 [Fibrobacter sp.]|nr:hypothetical protein [Fibrobacter sp.]
MRAALLALVVALFASLVGCSDDGSSEEFLFDREISDLSVLRECASDADSGLYCYLLRYRYPIDTNNLRRIYLWVTSTVVDDTSKTVDEDQIAQATDRFEFPSGTAALFDTIDLTPYVQELAKDSDSVMVAIYCDYSSGRPGTLQRTFVHFGDDIDPSLLGVLHDSSWTTGAQFKWSRPTDQTEYYKPNELSGPIVGYNIVIRSDNKNEDLRKLKIRLESPDGVDSTGETLFMRHARIMANHDSVWVDSVKHGDNTKNRLTIMVKDGKGYNVDEPDSNLYRLIVEGLKAESEYSIAYSSWDTSGNSSGTEALDYKAWEIFYTTDSVAPLMPTKLFTIKDTLFPEMAKLDSNNRLRVFWSRSVDPYQKYHGIKVDSVLTIPDSCIFPLCYDTVQSYRVEQFNPITGEWDSCAYAGGSERYSKLYKISGDTMKVSSTGTFVVDTIRWVAPGDTLILRVRSIDKSGYYSVALVDTIVVSPGELAKEVECPSGFVAVKSSDTNFFCMERLEHQDDSGAFVTNVLHSEALAACEAISADGFKVSLCNERDWELVCLYDGTLSYGVVQEMSEAANYLFRDCNVATNNADLAADITKRSSHCMNPMGVRDMPGQYQEWVMGRSEDTVAVLKGGTYKSMSGLDIESQALCTNRSFPIFTRLAYTTDSVFLYREGTKVDTVYEADTSRTLYKVLTKKDFKDSLQFFDVQDSSGNSVGTDYAPYAEYKKGGDEWLEQVSNGMVYVPDHIEVVFLTGERVSYRGVANFYKSPSIGFRCCAYKE